MKLTEEILQENKLFLDEVALETMKVYITRKPPQSFEDSISIARVAYRQALAMLEIRENSLLRLAKDVRLIKSKENEL